MLQNSHFKQGSPVVLADAAPVAAALVGQPGAPVDPRGLVAHGKDGGGGVEVCHLGRKQLANSMEDEPAHTEQVDPISSLQDASNLLHLVALDVDAAQNGEDAQLVFAGPLQLVLGAQHGLVLEEHAARPDGAGEVVDVGAAQAVAAVGGAGLLAKRAQSPQTAAQRHLDVHQGAPLSLIHLRGPEGTVQVHPQVDVYVQQPSRPIGGAVTFLVAEAALAFIPRQPFWAQRNPQALHQLRHLAAGLLLRAALAYGDDYWEALPADPLPFLHVRKHLLFIDGEGPAVLQGLNGRLQAVGGLFRKFHLVGSQVLLLGGMMDIGGSGGFWICAGSCSSCVRLRSFGLAGVRGLSTDVALSLRLDLDLSGA